jgi:hypothetical protein
MAIRKLGCVGSLVFGLLVVLAVTALMVPWAFHIGGRWTPTTSWQGVGHLRDSSGQQYGLQLSFFPDISRRGRGAGVHVGPAYPTPRSPLRGKALVCTAGGLRIPFDVRGDMYGAWLDAEGKLASLNLSEHSNDKPKRHFSLYGSFHGPELSLDDHKSMFMYLQPDGKLTPTRSYTSPVPEKHASVTLQWGNETDFDSLCGELRR